jgi:uncharacterized protein
MHAPSMPRGVRTIAELSCGYTVASGTNISGDLNALMASIVPEYSAAASITAPRLQLTHSRHSDGNRFNRRRPRNILRRVSAVNHDRYDDLYLRKILRDTKTIAMVGASANWNRPSYFAMKYLLDRGYVIMPVNPVAAGQNILGQKVYGSLADLPKKADMVDIFRNSAAAGPITDEAIDHGAKVVWMQLGVRNDQAAKRAEDAGLKVVMNRCPKIEHSRLSGTIEWHGIASGVITSKKRAL